MTRAHGAILWVFLLCSVFCLGQQTKQTRAEQTSFCEDGAPEELQLKPTALPQAVVAAIIRTEQGREAKEEDQARGREFIPAKLLRGTEIHLSHQAGRFYLVMGSPPLSGADNTWFWIVEQTGQEVRILLFAGANCLDIDRKQTLGYKNVTTTWSSPQETITDIYAYNGREYKRLRRRFRPNK